MSTRRENPGLCERLLGEIELEGKVRPYHCYGHVRTLYVREVVDGQGRGWRAVGTVCLQCHEVRLDEGKLPDDPRRHYRPRRH